MANPIIEDTLHTHDIDGNVIDVYPKTRDSQVEGYESYIKGLSCDDHKITYTRGDGSTGTIEVSNEIITDEEIMTLWDITDSSEKYY